MPVIKKPVENPRLFEDDDPLVVVIPGAGDVRLSDYNVNPPLEDEVSPETAPVSYLIEYVIGALHGDATQDEVDKVREALSSGVVNNTLTVKWLGELIGEIAEAYQEAFEAAVAKESGRPTRRRRR